MYLIQYKKKLWIIPNAAVGAYTTRWRDEAARFDSLDHAKQYYRHLRALGWCRLRIVAYYSQGKA
jgi:hypothetical protein